MIRKYFFELILISDKHPSIWDKITYAANLLPTFSAIAYLLDGINFWFVNNKQFMSFMIVALAINMIVGAAKHQTMNTFKWELFFKKNSLIIAVCIIVYVLLEMLRLTAGSNWVGETFKIIIQITTLLYPTSKALKNIYILTNKEFPPEFIMEKVYNFEKDGDIKAFFNKDENDKEQKSE